MLDSASRDKTSYAAAGVDIEAGEHTVEKIKELARKTFTSNVLSEIGSFGGFFKAAFGSMEEPVLVSSADGVGTKLKLAFMTDRHNTVGEDLVNHCINDILVHGARPLFFLDYIATGKLKPDTVAQIVEGLSRGCEKNGVALLGGETAEMPGFYQPGEYDLAGFIVGVVDRARIINGSSIADGDVCIGLGSNGLHTNGYTLARRIVFDMAGLKPNDKVKELGSTISEALLNVHTSYLSSITPLLERFDIHGMAHITGGGLGGNLKRIIPDSLAAVIDTRTWSVPPIFHFLQEAGKVTPQEMFKAFNMGIGFVIIAPLSQKGELLKALQQEQIDAWEIGVIEKSDRKVQLSGL